VSYDAILARSPSIIYQPGGTASGLIVTSWAQVQKFIVARQGSVIVYVDDSITSPAPVPGVTGITACDGRVELRPYAVDGTTFVVLEIEDGATLQDLYAVRAMELRCNCQSATPSLTWTIAPTGGDLNLFDFASLTNSATATNPAISIPAGKQFFLLSTTSFIILHAPAVPLVAIPATAVFNLEVMDGTGVPSGLVSGAGSFSLVYDNASSALFPTPQVPPTQPAFTGQYLPTNLDSLFPSPGSQLQATWFIDPSNSTGNASDFNSGIDAAHPVLTYQSGVAKKWNTYSPVLNQNTTLTWLSSQPAGNPAGDPVIFTPIIGATAPNGPGAFVLVEGTLGPAQQLFAGSLASVTPKNRAAAQLLQADLGFAAPIGSIVQNTTGGKTSFASVYKNISGTVFALAQPLAPQTTPAAFPPVEVDTWANGDTFVLYQPVFVDLLKVDASLIATFLPPNFPDQLQIQNIRSSAGTPVGEGNTTVGTNIAMVNVTCDTALCITAQPNDVGNFYIGVSALGGVYDGSQNFDGVWAGGFILSPFTGGTLIENLGWDVIIDATGGGDIELTASTGGDELLLGTGGGAYITGSIFVASSCRLTIIDGNVVWGPGGLSGLGSSHTFYNNTAVATFLQTGTTATEPVGAPLALNFQTSAVTFDPTTGLWSTLIPITAANLDLAKTSGGFGGLAATAGGASISTNP